MCLSPLVFRNISFSNLNVQQINPGITIYNMNLYAESAESQLLNKILGLNNCMFGKLINVFSVCVCGGGWIELSSFYFAIHTFKRDGKLR